MTFSDRVFSKLILKLKNFLLQTDIEILNMGMKMNVRVISLAKSVFRIQIHLNDTMVYRVFTDAAFFSSIKQVPAAMFNMHCI